MKPVAEVVEGILQSILATPKHQRRLRSKTFWAEFGFKMRTHERVKQVKQALPTRCDRESRRCHIRNRRQGRLIILTFVEQPRPPMVLSEEADTTPIPTPDDAWFDLMAHREFDSEREVEYYFVVPLLEQLGYAEETSPSAIRCKCTKV